MVNKRQQPLSYARLLILCLCLTGANVSAKESKISNEMERIKNLYNSQKYLDLQLTQERRSPYINGSIKSKIKITWQPDHIVYKILDPVETTVIYKNNTLNMYDEGNHKAQLPKQLQIRIKQVLNFIEALLLSKWVELKRDFTLTFTKHSIEATPKAKSDLIFLGRVAIKFKANLSIESITIGSGEDQSKMIVETQTFKKINL